MDRAADWLDEKYTQVFEEELRGLERRRAHDPSCTIRDIEMQLRSFYISEGNDQEGRGAVGDTVFAATIAAYEQFIEEWKTAAEATAPYEHRRS
jgi:hypothetical protein